MHNVVKEILENHNYSKEQRIKLLNDLAKDIEFAKDVENGKFKHCPVCDDYYLTKSFFEEKESVPTQICTYSDPINSGGNEYAPGIADVVYLVCPKGHKREISRNEHLK